MATRAYKEKFNKDFFEQQAWQNGDLICGIDEVGRGCLAGPVVTAAVVLHPGKISRHLKDSKLMTQEELHKAYSWIIKRSWYAIGIIHNRTIDQHNIYQATLKSMKRALMQTLALCPQQPVQVLTDAMPLVCSESVLQELDILYFSKGERKSSSIAAASIVAKVRRDALMRIMDPLFPHYALRKHKGYSTSHHKQAIAQHGHSIMHRMSFLLNKPYTVQRPADQRQTFLPAIFDPHVQEIDEAE